MKKTYATPAVATSGNVVRETLVANQPIGAESSFLTPKSGGSVGFCL